MCTCVYVQTHVSTRKPKHMDANLSDLKWPTSVALGSSDRKEQATKTQARSAPGQARTIHHGHLDVSPSDKEQTGLSSWPSLSGRMAEETATAKVLHYARV